MKQLLLFFFKSSASSNGNNDTLPPKVSHKQTKGDNFSEKSENSFQGPESLFSKSLSQILTSQNSSNGPALRRSGLLSWAAFLGFEHRDTDESYQRSAKEEKRRMKEELDSWMNRLEKEKEVQSGPEKKLDRRSDDWSLELEKYQSKEKKLIERVTELAIQNVSLQRQVYSSSEKESYLEQHVKELTKKIEDYQTVQQTLTEMAEKYEIAEENKRFFLRNFVEKDEECKLLHKSLARLLWTCSEQEKTINGLREGFSEEVQENLTERLDMQVIRMQKEQMRLTGVEMALRKELESSRVDVETLKRENMYLLHRVKGNGREFVASTAKLEEELQSRICYLQKDALTMLNESTRLSTELLGFVKGKTGHLHHNSQQDMEVISNGLDGQFLLECDVKRVSSVLLEKSSHAGAEVQSPGTAADRLAEEDETSEYMLKNELKAERQMTALLREKLYSKEVEVEQLQAELATAVRGNDCLRLEVQNLQDNLSFVTHIVNDLRLEDLKKDENISWLHSDLEKCTEELTAIRGLLPEVSEEKDRMWEELKRSREENKLLVAHVNELKEKIETLDTDIHLKDGQITILKDCINERPYDLLSGADSSDQFLLR